MGSSPSRETALCVFKGLAGSSDILPNAAEEQVLCAELIAIQQLEGGGHGFGCGCDEWLKSLFAQIRGKAEELDRLLLFAIRMLEAERPGHRLRLLPLRNTRLAIGFEVSKLLEELEEVTHEW